jgi:hypothetical protein
MLTNDLKHIRMGGEVFLKTQVLRKLSGEIESIVEQMVRLYASGHDGEEITRLDRMIKQRAEIMLQLTEES